MAIFDQLPCWFNYRQVPFFCPKSTNLRKLYSFTECIQKSKKSIQYSIASSPTLNSLLPRGIMSQHIIAGHIFVQYIQKWTTMLKD